MPDGRLICYRHGAIEVYKGKNRQKDIPFPTYGKENLLGRSCLATRLFRFGVRAASAIDHDHIALSIGDKIKEMDVNIGILSRGYSCDDGVRPLTFTSILGIKGFDDGLYFGGYVHNFDKKPVHIYHRVGEDKWDIIYSFSQGEINHIHNLIPDPYRQCLWIFTGDFDDSAAIWKATDGFKKVERVVSGNQKWRGCVAFSIPEGVLYATDAPFAQNHIHLIRNDRSTDVIVDLPGSCIYGCQWGDKYVFSTAVEADGRNETLLRLMLGWKRGAGVKDSYVHVYAGNLNEGFKEIYKEKKDLWPFIFQFGALKFPAGMNGSDTLYFQPVATSKNDLDLMAFRVVI